MGVQWRECWPGQRAKHGPEEGRAASPDACDQGLFLTSQTPDLARAGVSHLGSRFSCKLFLVHSLLSGADEITENTRSCRSDMGLAVVALIY